MCRAHSSLDGKDTPCGKAVLYREGDPDRKDGSVVSALAWNKGDWGSAFFSATGFLGDVESLSLPVPQFPRSALDNNTALLHREVGRASSLRVVRHAGKAVMRAKGMLTIGEPPTLHRCPHLIPQRVLCASGGAELS